VKEKKFEKISTGLHIAFIPTSSEKEIRTILLDRVLGVCKGSLVVYKDLASRVSLHYEFSYFCF